MIRANFESKVVVARSLSDLSHLRKETAEFKPS